MVDEDVKKLHADFTAEVRKRQISSSENFDKSVLTLSSGGLAFSLGFLKDFIPIDRAVQPWVLYASWIALTAATCATIISFLLSLHAQGVAQKNADDYYLRGDDTAIDRRNRWDEWNQGLNFCSVGFFVVGIVLTTLFVSINLERAHAVKDTNSTLAHDGLPAPMMTKILGSSDMSKGLPAPSMTARPTQQVPAASAPAAPTAPTPTSAGTPGKK